MRKNNADIGGELSGHFFFKEMKYSDSAVLAMLKILKILSDTGKSISELIKPWQKYYFSGEINIEIESKDLISKIFRNLEEKYREGKLDRLDGLTFEFNNWWFNLRPSNTEALVRLVIEAKSKELMNEKVEEITSEIKKSAN